MLNTFSQISVKMYAIVFQEPNTLLAPILFYLLFVCGGNKYETNVAGNHGDKLSLWVSLFHGSNTLRDAHIQSRLSLGENGQLYFQVIPFIQNKK